MISVFGEALADDFGSHRVIGGAPFNVARHLAAFGADPLMVTRIGDDALGAEVRAEFTRFGMRTEGLQVGPGEPTGRVEVSRTADGGHAFRILPDQAYDRITPSLAGARAATLYFGTLGQRDPRSHTALHHLMGHSQAVRYLDLNLRDGQVAERVIDQALHEADIVKLNEEELAHLMETYASADLLDTFGWQALIITRGEHGAHYFSGDGVTLVTPGLTLPGPFADTVGAGDAFSAVFLLGRARGWPLEQTLARANAFAAAICTVPGAVPDNLRFYERFAW